MRFALLGEGPGFQVGAIGSLIVTVHTQAASLALIQKLDEVMEAHRKTFPRFSVLALVTGAGIKSPEPGLKDLVIAQEKRFQSALVGAAIAIEARGLTAVLTRSFLAAYTLLSSHQFPIQSFGSTEQAVAWLQQLPEQEHYFRGNKDCAAEARDALKRNVAA